MTSIWTRLGLWLVIPWFSGCAALHTNEAATAVDAHVDAHVSAKLPVVAKTYVWSRSMEAKRVAIEASTRGSGIVVLRTKDNQLQINVPSEFSFDTDSAGIKPGMRPVLDQVAEDLEAAPMSRMLILVVGHTDSRGADAVNDSLSLARAVSVRKYLEGKGINSARIAAEGRGEREPQVDNDQSYGRALNRRVEIFLREPGD